MNLDRKDEKLEGYLRQFQARAPRPLPRQEKRIVFWRPAPVLAAGAAMVVLALTLFVLRGGRTTHRQGDVATGTEPIAQEISLIRFSRIAQQDPEKLGSHLDKLSTRLLPDVRQSRGVLKQLARE